MKKHNSPPMRGEISEIFAATAVFILLIVLAYVIRFCSAEPEITDDVSAATSESVPIISDTTVHSSVSLPYEIEAGIALTSLSSADGKFVENGEDEDVKGVLCASFYNSTAKTVEYFTAEVNIDGDEFFFAVSTLPPDAEVNVLEKNKKSAPESADQLIVECEYLIFFENEPTIHSESLDFAITDGTIVVTNKTENPITSDIVIYYKNMHNGIYTGGITYRLRIAGGLDAGEVFNGYAPHASADATRIMFVDYE